MAASSNDLGIILKKLNAIKINIVEYVPCPNNDIKNCGIIVPITLNPTIDSISVNTIILGIVRSGIGKINAKINIMYQKLRPLNEYLDNAKPVVSDTAV